MIINWESIYDGTIRPVPKSVDLWGVREARASDAEWGFVYDLDMGTDANLNKKFDVPIKPIPWLPEFEDNVSLTLEWLIRDHRGDSIRLSDEPIMNHVRDFWYRSEHYDGQYAHVCYPQDLLKFRGQYTTAYQALAELPVTEMSTKCIGLRRQCKTLLWNQWHCIGKDGVPQREKPQDKKPKPVYHYKCDRCQEPMPKAIKAYAILTQSKLKDIVDG